MSLREWERRAQQSQERSERRRKPRTEHGGWTALDYAAAAVIVFLFLFAAMVLLVLFGVSAPLPR